LRDCPAPARVVAVARRLTAVIALDDAMPKEEEDDDSSRWDSEGDGRTATATALGILVFFVLGGGFCFCWVRVAVCLGVDGVERLLSGVVMDR
jgi:hypothetical protein